MVLRKYLVQKALDSKLDREPGVLLKSCDPRDVVLATEYVAHAVNSKPVTQEEVDKYVASNPLKFANRQAVSVEQIVLPSSGPACRLPSMHLKTRSRSMRWIKN